jgi:hypothetical protein
MATTTTRMGLRKPDPTDVVSVSTDLNSPYDTVDLNIGVRICTSGSRPGSPFSGLVIYETDTKRKYHWNGSAWEWLSTGGFVPLTTATVDTTSIAAGGTNNRDVMTISGVAANGTQKYRIFAELFGISSGGANVLCTMRLYEDGVSINQRRVILPVSNSSQGFTMFEYQIGASGTHTYTLNLLNESATIAINAASPGRMTIEPWG